jgi:hypothetical protein
LIVDGPPLSVWGGEAVRPLVEAPERQFWTLRPFTFCFIGCQPAADKQRSELKFRVNSLKFIPGNDGKAKAKQEVARDDEGAACGHAAPA